MDGSVMDGLVDGLEGYREYYAAKTREDETYFRCLALMTGETLEGSCGWARPR
jgi:hypothetical protein